jgi:hypothetical protein
MLLLRQRQKQQHEENVGLLLLSHRPVLLRRPVVVRIAWTILFGPPYLGR